MQNWHSGLQVDNITCRHQAVLTAVRKVCGVTGTWICVRACNQIEIFLPVAKILKGTWNATNITTID